MTVHDAGVSGETTAGGLARLDWVLNSLKRTPDLVILELGANDMLRGQSPEQAKANLDAMLAKLRQRRIKVLLAGMLAAPNLGRITASASTRSTRRWPGNMPCRFTRSFWTAWRATARCSSQTACTRTRRALPSWSGTSCRACAQHWRERPCSACSWPLSRRRRSARTCCPSWAACRTRAGKATTSCT
ncbi:GDSL-type esterase/lipase family protein [Hankyongella ginsenosidimutans]|uniref:GDSL-type esterase/lipase family protein n=1 Tax=Hankyongella ginsenosidimutans TaxID=1763828 RepID=UPI003CCC5772